MTRSTEEATYPAGTALPSEVYTSRVPVLLRGFISHWPAVAACSTAGHASEYLSKFWSDQPLTVYVGEPKFGGRFAYNADYSGFNFRRGTARLEQVLAKLQDAALVDKGSIYVGSTPIKLWLNGFDKDNHVELPVDDALASFWLGNRTCVSAHFDLPDNLACIVSGRRRFTLFPPDQLENLYVGPIDNTPSGRAISLVDFDAPDFERFPAFSEALSHAEVADLNAGDALFIPSMWWHHVRGRDQFNLLVNYWWRASPAWLGSPQAALNHALLTIRDLPEDQRKVWRKHFDHYVFDAGEENFAHIPPGARGVLGPLDESMAQRLRAELINSLKV